MDIKQAALKKYRVSIAGVVIGNAQGPGIVARPVAAASREEAVTIALRALNALDIEWTHLNVFEEA